MSTPLDEITDHALVRWLERVHGVDMEAYRAELRQECRRFLDMKVETARVGDLFYVFKNGRLITVTPKLSINQLHADKRNRPDPPRDVMNWKARTRKRPHK